MQQAMRVTEIKLEQERDYSARGYPTYDITKVTVVPIGEDHKAGAYLTCVIITVPRFVPNPYHIGQRLMVVVGEGVAAMPAPIDLDAMAEPAPRPAWPLHDSTLLHETRDEAVGLGDSVADRVAQDLMPAAVGEESSL